MAAKIPLLSLIFTQETPIGRVRHELEVGDRLVLQGVEYRVMGKFAKIPWGDDKFAPGTRWVVRVQSLEELAKESNWKHRLEREESLLKPLFADHRRLSNGANP